MQFGGAHLFRRSARSSNKAWGGQHLHSLDVLDHCAQEAGLVQLAIDLDGGRAGRQSCAQPEPPSALQQALWLHAAPMHCATHPLLMRSRRFCSVATWLPHVRCAGRCACSASKARPSPDSLRAQHRPWCRRPGQRHPGTSIPALARVPTVPDTNGPHGPLAASAHSRAVPGPLAARGRHGSGVHCGLWGWDCRRKSVRAPGLSSNSNSHSSSRRQTG